MPTSITGREALKLASLALVKPRNLQQGVKKIIVAGAGIGGLSCAWELMRRGHEVSVLEASARTGGHVFTFREGLDDGLYADGGAEHFTQPGYEKFWSYVREFNLPYLYYPRREHLLRWIDGRMYTPDMLADDPVERVEFERGMTYWPPATLALIVTLAAIFVWQVATGTLSTQAGIVDAGALVRSRVIEGEYWRMFTATMLHGSGEHLFEGIDLHALGYDCVDHLSGERATHVFLRRRG